MLALASMPTSSSLAELRTFKKPSDLRCLNPAATQSTYSNIDFPTVKRGRTVGAVAIPVRA